MAAPTQPRVRPVPDAPAVPAPELTLANGLRLLPCELPGRGLTAIHVMLGAGARTDPAGHAGVAGLLAGLCGEGSADRSPDEFVAALERQGARLSAGADHDGAHLTVAAPAERIGSVVELVASAVATPALPEAQVRRAIQRRRAAIASEAVHPLHRARAGLRRLTYPSGSPYAHAAGGTAATIGAIDRATLVAQHSRWYGPANARVLVVGEVERLGDRVATAFDGWHHPVEPESPPAPELVDEFGWQVDPLPATSQAMLMLGGTIRADDPAELVALELAVHALGGWFGSRLTTVLRERLGYTYGFFTEFLARRTGRGHTGEFCIYASVDHGVLTDAVARLIGECADLADGLAADEIDGARHSLISRERLLTQTVQHIIDGVGGRLRRGQPTGDRAARLADVSRVDADLVRAAAARHLNPARLRFVAVGDADGCERALAPLAERYHRPLGRAADTT